MDLYIDYNNLRSLIIDSKKDDGGNGSKYDCLRMIRKQLRLVYNFDKGKFFNDPYLKIWLLKERDGKGESDKDVFGGDGYFPARPIKSNSYVLWSWSQLSSVYLLNDVDTCKLEDTNSILIGKQGEEFGVLNKLFCGTDYDFSQLINLHGKENVWDVIANSGKAMPCTDIVINDRYMFTDQQEVVDYNLNLMLTSLVKGCRNKIDIVIFTFSLEEQEYKRVRKTIEDTVKRETGKSANLTFITVSRPHGKHEEKRIRIPHDRFILTNYQLIRSGDSFNYYNCHGDVISQGLSVEVDSLAKLDTFNYSKALIDNMQDIYEQIISVNRDYVYGDKKSRFINFETDN